MSPASALRYPRTHEALRPDITRDPIFLFQERRILYANNPYTYDSDAEAFFDASGEEVSTDRLIEEGYAMPHWDTVTVFLTREDGEEWGRARAYNFPDGWRVYCVAAKGDLVNVLAEVTEGGRYA